jgi:hypothetical protein
MDDTVTPKLTIEDMTPEPPVGQVRPRLKVFEFLFSVSHPLVGSDQEWGQEAIVRCQMTDEAVKQGVRFIPGTDADADRTTRSILLPER